MTLRPASTITPQQTQKWKCGFCAEQYWATITRLAMMELSHENTSFAQQEMLWVDDIDATINHDHQVSSLSTY